MKINTRKILWSLGFLAVSILMVLLVSNGRFFKTGQYTPPVNVLKKEKKNVFLDFLSAKKKLPRKSEEVSFIFVGDVSFSRAVERMIQRQNDVNYPFWQVDDYLGGADLVFGNLETPITPGALVPDYSMVFRSNPGVEQALKQAGFSVLSLANNHTANFGEKGLIDTFNFLRDAGLAYVGAGENDDLAYQPIFIEKKGIKFAFLAYSDMDFVPINYEATAQQAGIAFMRLGKMRESVAVAKQEADFVIVSMHAGTEYTEELNTDQINFARAAIDAGVDLVVGHHPHVVQKVEEYKGRYIFYSLGNFVFDQPQSEDTKNGLAVKIYFTKDNIAKINLLPVVMKNLAQPEPAGSDQSDKILSRLKLTIGQQAAYYWSDDLQDFSQEIQPVFYVTTTTSGGVSDKIELSDIDNNSLIENYNLAQGRLTIMENKRTIWQSPDDWWVDNFVLADANNDGIKDINLSLWKSGSFGSSQPFWIEENDPSVRNHFFVLDLTDGMVRQVWGSSNLSRPNCEFAVLDIDNDSKNELVVVEGEYSPDFQCQGKYVAVWQWGDWGFVNEWRSEPSDFTNLTIEKNEGKNYILLDNF